MHKEARAINLRIGFFGYQPKVGVTNLALTFSTLLSSRQGKKVWYLEIGPQHTVEKLVSFINGTYIGEHGEFQSDGITFFPNLSVKRTIDLLKCAPEVVMIDFGKISPEKEKVLAMCEQRILVCDFSLWNQETIIQRLFRQKEDKNKNWNQCVCYFGKRHIKKVERQLKEKVYPLPDIVNPFCVGKEELKDIMKL